MVEKDIPQPVASEPCETISNVSATDYPFSEEELLPFPLMNDTTEGTDNEFRPSVNSQSHGVDSAVPCHLPARCWLREDPAKCRLLPKYQAMKKENEESDALLHNDWLELSWYWTRVQQLEAALRENGIPSPPEEEWPFEGFSYSGPDA